MPRLATDDFDKVGKIPDAENNKVWEKFPPFRVAEILSKSDSRTVGIASNKRARLSFLLSKARKFMATFSATSCVQQQMSLFH